MDSVGLPPVAGGTENVLRLRVAGGGGSNGNEVRLRYVESSEGLLILAPCDPLPRWAQTLSRTGVAHWTVAARDEEGIAEPIRDSDAALAAARSFESRFGKERFSRWFSGGYKVYRLMPGDRSSAGYSRLLEEYFDRLAPSYDAMVAANPLDSYLRHASLELLLSAFHPGDRVLEIGAGTGLESLPLARAGVRVMATDISAAMLERLTSKARLQGLSDRIVTRRLRAASLPLLVHEFPSGAFDGAFSDFGALNCEPDAGELPRALADLLRPGAPLILGVWNRFCASETLLALAARRPRRALARLQSPVPVGLSRYGVPAYPQDPRVFARLFAPWFEVEQTLALPVILPPYDFGSRLMATGGLLPILARLDSALRARFPFRYLGDHFLLVLRRRNSPSHRSVLGPVRT